METDTYQSLLILPTNIILNRNNYYKIATKGIVELKRTLILKFYKKEKNKINDMVNKYDHYNIEELKVYVTTFNYKLNSLIIELFYRAKVYSYFKQNSFLTLI